MSDVKNEKNDKKRKIRKNHRHEKSDARASRAAGTGDAAGAAGAAATAEPTAKVAPGAKAEKAPRIVPKKVFESWFTVFDAADPARQTGWEHLFWEPHRDRTAWLERSREMLSGDFEKMHARFSIDDWPRLKWCRFKADERATEFALEGEAETEKPRPRAAPPLVKLPAQGDLIPASLAPLIAASLPTTPGESLALTILDERLGEMIAGVAMVCHGADRIEIAGEPFETFRYTLERLGKVQATYWVDSNRRIRKMDLGATVAILSTRAAAKGEPA